MIKKARSVGWFWFSVAVLALVLHLEWLFASIGWAFIVGINGTNYLWIRDRERSQ